MSKSIEVDKLLDYVEVFEEYGLVTHVTHDVDKAIYWEPLMRSIVSGTRKSSYGYCKEME